MGRDLQKPFREFKTVDSILLTKYCSHRTEISTKDIVILGDCSVRQRQERGTMAMATVVGHLGHNVSTDVVGFL